MKPDCVFEPDSVAVRCIDCGKPTGLTGTCKETDFCSSCKEDFIQSAMKAGPTRSEAEAKFSALLVSLIEGTHPSQMSTRPSTNT
jgi:hypothetical protein